MQPKVAQAPMGVQVRWGPRPPKKPVGTGPKKPVGTAPAGANRRRRPGGVGPAAGPLKKPVGTVPVRPGGVAGEMIRRKQKQMFPDSTPAVNTTDQFIAEYSDIGHETTFKRNPNYNPNDPFTRAIFK